MPFEKIDPFPEYLQSFAHSEIVRNLSNDNENERLGLSVSPEYHSTYLLYLLTSATIQQSHQAWEITGLKREIAINRQNICPAVYDVGVH